MLKCVPHVQHAYSREFNYEATTATATKTSLENKHLGNSDYFIIIASSSLHPLLLTEHAASGLIVAPL